MNALIDPYQRSLTYVRLSVTDLCNFKCSYCLPSGYVGKQQSNPLSLREIHTLVQAFAELGIQKIRLTGGEPTLRKDLSDIIALCKQTEGITTVALTSNGYRLGLHARAWRQAGLDQVNISIDSFKRADFKAITGVDALPGIVKGVDTLLELDFKAVKINAVLMHQYAAQTLQDSFAFVKTRPVSVRFIELMQTGGNHDVFFRQHISAAHIVAELQNKQWLAQPRTPTAGPAVEYAHPDYAGSIGVIAPYAEHFCATCNRLRVSSSGNMHLCLFDSVAHNLRPWLADGDVAGLRDYLTASLQLKPTQHLLAQQHSGLISNLSIIGG
jgi:GTP 3',8-cyclase